MRYVQLRRESYGNAIDPTPYLDRLSDLLDALPPGARAFAAEPAHYDFHSERCVKSLTPLLLHTGEDDGVPWAELRLRHNCWKHDEDLTVRYTGVREIRAEPATARDEVTELLDVIIDEVLPHPDGCSHEVACLSGSLTVISRDLIATWSRADCPERPAHSDGTDLDADDRGG